MLQREHSAILSTIIKLPFSICLFLSGRLKQVLLYRDILSAISILANPAVQVHIKVHGIMNTCTSGLLQVNFARDQSIHDSLNLPEIEFIAFIYILL